MSPATVDKAGPPRSSPRSRRRRRRDTPTEDLVKRLRDDVIPKATKGTDLTANVGGQTAAYIDLADRISDKLPQMIAIVVGLSCIVLLLAFRSILLPRQGRGGEPALGRRRVRRRHVRLPGGPRRLAARPRRRGSDRELRAAAHVRDPVRALDGLRGVPAHPDPGALQEGRRRPRGGGRRAGVHRAG